MHGSSGHITSTSFTNPLTMRNILPLLALVLGAPASWAQCFPFAIPPNAELVTTNGDLSTVDGIYWVCTGLAVTMSGNDITAYVEENCSVTIDGNDVTAYVRSGCIVGINADDVSVWHDTDASVVDNGDGNLVVDCMGPLTFDYSSAPTATDCVGLGIVDGHPAHEVVIAFANPAREQLAITGCSAWTFWT